LTTFGFIYLDQADIEDIHRDQLIAHGGQAGIRNRHGLASSINQPKATFDGEDLYPDVFSKAAVYAFSIAENQVFVDGNKRTGLVAALTFLRVNGIKIPKNENKLYHAMIAIAKHKMNQEDLAELFRSLSVNP
jgi:death on curing protein